MDKFDLKATALKFGISAEQLKKIINAMKETEKPNRIYEYNYILNYIIKHSKNIVL